MGKFAGIVIAYMAGSLKDAFEEVESQIIALRQEIQDLKGKKPTPEPELQRGDFVSYRVTSEDNKKAWGLFHHFDSYQDEHLVWAHFQDFYGNFRSELTSMPKDRVTFEFRPEK